MKSYFINIFALFFLSSMCIAEEKLNEQAIIQTVNAYAKNPTKINAIKALEVIPGMQSDPVGRIYSDKLINNLEKQIKNHDQSALELAVRLINIADGAFALDLYVIIVDISTNNSALFLKVLNDVKDQELTEALLINMSDPGLNECKIWIERKQSLQRVKNTNLQDIKERSIKILEKEIKSCTQQGN